MNIGNLTRAMPLLDTSGMPDPKVPSLDLPASVSVVVGEIGQGLKASKSVSDHIALSTTKDSSAGWAADLVFATRGAADASTISTSNERMRIDQNGNVGIGNSSPNEKLHVTGNVKVTGSLYTSDLILNNLSKDSPNSVDGTRGHWRIQEGEDNLYIINEITKKKFKFKIQEVE